MTPSNRAVLLPAVLLSLLAAACQEGGIDRSRKDRDFWPSTYQAGTSPWSSASTRPLESLKHAGLLQQGYDVYLGQDGGRVDVVALPGDPNRPVLRDTFLEPTATPVRLQTFEDLTSLQPLNEGGCAFETKATLASVAACGTSRCFAVTPQGSLEGAGCEGAQAVPPPAETLTLAGTELQIPRADQPAPRKAALSMAGGATWSAVTGSGPSGLTGARSTVVGTVGYVAGLAGTPPAVAVYAYDFKTRAWSARSLTNAPTMVSHAALAWVGSTLVAVGDGGGAKWTAGDATAWETLSGNGADFVTPRTDGLYAVAVDPATVGLLRTEPGAPTGALLVPERRALAAASAPDVGPELALPAEEGTVVAVRSAGARLYVQVRATGSVRRDAVHVYDFAAKTWQTTALEEPSGCVETATDLVCLGSRGTSVRITDGKAPPTALPPSHLVADWDARPVQAFGSFVVAWSRDGRGASYDGRSQGDGFVLDLRTGVTTYLPELATASAPVGRFDAMLLFDGSSLSVWGGCLRYDESGKCTSPAVGGASLAVFAR